MEIIKIHCENCGGTGKVKKYKYDYEDTTRITCLTCEGTGIEKITEAEYNRRKEHERQESARIHKLNLQKIEYDRANSKAMSKANKGFYVGIIVLIFLWITTDMFWIPLFLIIILFYLYITFVVKWPDNY